MNWLDRKLQSWEEGRVVDPVNGTVVSLPTYLRTIEHAGRRCQVHDWERIYRKNIWMYQEKGLLPDDWESDTSTTRRADGRRLPDVSQAPDGDSWLSPAELEELVEVLREQQW